MLICTAPHHTAGGQQGEEVTVKRAIAASATTLQQCGLPGSSAQPGGIAAAHGAGGGGLGERSSPCWPVEQGEGISAAPTPARWCPGDTQCHRAVPTGRHCSTAHLLGCPAQPPAWLLYSLHSDLWAPGYGSVPISYPSLSVSDLLSGQCR